MAHITSHILNAITGRSATGIRVQLVHVGEESPLFDVVADQEGRVSENVSLDKYPADSQFELIFYTADYFGTPNDNMGTVVIRMRLPDHDKRYHVPLVLSPQSYTIWRSV